MGSSAAARNARTDVRNEASNTKSAVNKRGERHNLIEHNQKAVEHAKDCPRSH